MSDHAPSDRPNTPTSPHERPPVNLAALPIDQRLARAEAHLEIAQDRLGVLERRAGRAEQGVVRIEARMTHMEGQLASLQAGVVRVEARVDEIRPDVLRVRRLLAWGGGAGFVILAVMEALQAFGLFR